VRDVTTQLDLIRLVSNKNVVLFHWS